MLKLSVNRVRIDLRIEPVTPLLIKSGEKGAALLRPELPDLTFVRTGPRETETVYIPGSSIKGVVRSAAERVIRTVERHCCDPMDQKNPCHDAASDLGDKIARRGGEGPHPQAAVYKMVCYACRTFGSQALASHASFADAYPPKGADRDRANATERRNGVSINRQTGGPARGKLFEQEVVTGGAFDATLHLVNVQLWQVGLVGIVLRDVAEGFVRFGSAKSRGLGHVRVVPKSARFEQTGTRLAVPGGLAALRADLAPHYDLLPPESDRLPDAVEGQLGETPIGLAWDWSGEKVWNLFDACSRAPWRAFCDQARTAAT